jgi:hypothetical protein
MMIRDKLVAGIVGLACCAFLVGPALAQTDTTPAQPDNTIATPDVAGPTMTMDGIVADINWTNCTNEGSASCMTTVDLTAAPAPVMESGNKGTEVAANDPVEIIIPAGASVTLGDGATVPTTELRKGDELVVDYQAYDYGNVATSVEWRARLSRN